jgi:uncharacterized membrane protein
VSKYFAANYLLVEDKTKKVKDIIKESITLTRGKRWEIVKFELSFFGWFLLYALFTALGSIDVSLTVIFVLPMFFILPYINSSFAVFGKYVIYSSRSKNKVKTDATVEFEVNKPE